MPPRRAWARYAPRGLLAILALAVLLAVPWPALGSSLPGVPPAPHVARTTGSIATPLAATPSAGNGGLPAISQPFSSNSTDGFYRNYTLPFQAPNQQGCSTFGFVNSYWYNYCYPEQYNPSIVTLPDGNVGLGYELNTNSGFTSCASQRTNEHQRVGFAVSANNGSSFGSPVVLGNASCTYLEAIEPSFAVAGGRVLGAFTEENQSFNTAGSYTYRAAVKDAIGFTSSANDGASWSPTVTAYSSYDLAYPRVVGFGSTVYILFTDLANSTSYVQLGGPFGYCSCNPPSTKLIYSTNNGSTWNGPYTIPGSTAGAGYLTLGASLAVNSTGALALSYFTGNKCVQLSGSYCYDYGVNLYVAASKTNGTTWGARTLVATGVGEYSQNYEPNYYGVLASQYLPQSSVSFANNSTRIDVAWLGGFNRGGTSGYLYSTQAVWFSSALSNLSGGFVNSTRLAALTSTTTSDTLFDLSLGVSGSGVFVAYDDRNNTYSTYCNYYPCNYDNTVNNTIAGYVISSSDGGASWSQPTLAGAGFTQNCLYCTSSSWAGQTTAVGFSATGSPVFGFAFPGREVYTYYYNGSSVYNYTYPTYLNIALAADAGPTATVDVVQHGLGLANWTFTVQGRSITVSNSTTYQLTGIPLHQLIIFDVSQVPSASNYGERIAGTAGPEAANYSGNGTEFVNYSTGWLFQLGYEPRDPNDLEIEFQYGGTTYYEDAYTYCYSGCFTEHYSNPPLPWYFPNGTQLQLSGPSTPAVDYWNGTGSRAYNGSGLDANITINGVVNETGWEGGFGTYNVSFVPKNLPVSSLYHFTLDGVAYGAGGTQSITATDLATGSHQLTNVWANSSTAGYEYFGSTSATPLLVPVDPIVNLSFSLVDVMAAAGNTTFHAVGLSLGSVWQLSFNGTIYSSATPWINVTTRPGTYAVGGYPVVAANGTAALSPTDLTAPVTVSVGGSYDVTFSSTYRLNVVAGIGGSVSGGKGGTYWELPGATLSLLAATASGYSFGQWTGTGAGSYTGTSPYANFTMGGAVTETASYFPLPEARFNLTFTETGVPNGTWWSVDVGGVAHASDVPVLTVPNLYPCGTSTGNYAINVPYAYLNTTGPVRYAPTSFPFKICTSGSTVQALSFKTQVYLTLSATAGGVALASAGAVTTTSNLWVAYGSSVSLSNQPFNGYVFQGWNGTGYQSYNGSTGSFTLDMQAPVTEIATFGIPYVPPPATYTLQLQEVGLALGTSWTAVLNGTTYSSGTIDLNISGLHPTTYQLAINSATSSNATTRYAPGNSPRSILVSRNTTTQVLFASSYWIAITSSAGGSVTLPANLDPWQSSGARVQLIANPDPGFEFVGWVGSGAGNYTGSAAFVNVTMDGPIVETASFAPVPAHSSSASSSLLTSTPFWLAIAIVGLVVALVVGLVVGRRGRPGTPAPAEPEPMAEWEGPTGPESPPPDVPAGETDSGVNP